jgi:hydrogenase small subunit
MGQESTASFYNMLDARGVSRRSFLKFCGGLAAAAGITGIGADKAVAATLEKSVIGATTGNLYPVIWIEGASCTGCTESLAQVETPDVGTIVLELLSLNFSDVLSAGAGESAELAKKQTIEAGNYIVVFEGAVTQAWSGNACRFGGNEDGSDSLTGMQQLEEAASNASAIVALGSCAVNGGWMGAEPNSAAATGVQAYLKSVGINKTIVNIPGCPANPEWLVSVLVQVLMLDGQTLELDSQNKPVGIFGQTIHDNCERRGHFENGEFVYKFGSEEEAKGYCLYPLGCRGPQTKSNCSITMWNNRRSWCVQAGSPCLGCCEANPNDPGDNWVEVNTPFYQRHRDLHVGGVWFQPTTVAVAVTGILAACLVIHGFGMKAAGRMDGGADFEKVRKWDEKHPDQSIGDYSVSLDTKKEEEAKAAAEAAAKAEEEAKAAEAQAATATDEEGR